MRCFQCDKQAVGICGWCLLGQCGEHMRAGLEARRQIPTMGCIHQFTGESASIGPAANAPAHRERS